MFLKHSSLSTETIFEYLETIDLIISSGNGLNQLFDLISCFYVNNI